MSIISVVLIFLLKKNTKELHQYTRLHEETFVRKCFLGQDVLQRVSYVVAVELWTKHNPITRSRKRAK